MLVYFVMLSYNFTYNELAGPQHVKKLKSNYIETGILVPNPCYCLFSE